MNKTLTMDDLDNRAPDLDDIFFAVTELAALLLILRLAWNWKKTRSLMGASCKEIWT